MSNIVTAYFGSLRTATTEALYKYNYGQILQFADIDLPDTYEVHLCNVGDLETKTAIGSADGVEIYDEYLRAGRDIVAYIVLHAAQDSGETEYKVTIPVKYRPVPGDTPPTPEQGDVISQAITALNNGVTRSEAAAEAAESSANSAEQSAEQAEAAETDVTDARDAAIAAKERAVQAEQSAQEDAELASGYAESANLDAVSAGQSAENAAQSAQEAAESATSAEGYAGQAETAAGLAQAAQTASEAARDAAQTAQASAESSATAASGSAASAAGSSSDASSSASAAGAYASAAGNAATQAEAAKTAAQNAQTAAETAADSIADKSAQIEQNRQDIAEQKSILSDPQYGLAQKAGLLRDSTEGAVASFVPDASVENLLGLTVDIEPVQAGSGDPSPDNVRPISAWNAVVVNATGINIWDEEWEVGGIINGVNAEARLRIRSANYIPVKGGKTLYFCFADGVYANGSWFSIAEYGRDKSYLRTLSPYKNTVVTIADDVFYIRFNLSDAWGGAEYTGGISINYPSTDHTYHPYAGNRYTITIGQTVYSCKLDVTAGTLTLDRKGIVFDGTQELPFLHAYGGGRWYDPEMNTTNAPSVDFISDRLSGALGRGNIGTPPVIKTYSAGYGEDTHYFLICPSTSITTSAELYAWLADNPTTIVYPITPITIQLDPVTIAAISGQTNNVWADAGDVDVTYAADLKMYIDQKIAAAVAAMS